MNKLRLEGKELPSEELVLEIDQSSGHMKKQEDGLTDQINKHWGGKQKSMHSSKIVAGCLGNEPGLSLSIGDTQ